MLELVTFDRGYEDAIEYTQHHGWAEVHRSTSEHSRSITFVNRWTGETGVLFVTPGVGTPTVVEFTSPLGSERRAFEARLKHNERAAERDAFAKENP